MEPVLLFVVSALHPGTCCLRTSEGYIILSIRSTSGHHNKRHVIPHYKMTAAVGYAVTERKERKKEKREQKVTANRGNKRHNI
jgi:hypothetical protein